MKDFKINVDVLEKIATHLPTGMKFKFYPTDVAPVDLTDQQVLLYDDLGGMWIGETLSEQHDDVILEAAWQAVTDRYWDEGG
ncbi:hypothetical protein [Parapedobacter sp. DT-150]|uniref:hypothetical protein n=1 Tax=Parapedobacter sp. DT-150 TaxID=3396162 RepID=UPI003F1A8764